MGYETKDSGSREEFDSGMVRDTDEGKARFDLLFPLHVPYAAQFLTRCADLMARGKAKYGDRNWEKADSQKELDRAISSAIRHLTQWATGADDEDHAAAVVFNLLEAETIKYKMDAAAAGGYDIPCGPDCLICKALSTSASDEPFTVSEALKPGEGLLPADWEPC